jgi:hypothetical protein
MDLLFKNQLAMMEALMQVNPSVELMHQIKATQRWLKEREPVKEASPEQIVDFFTRGMGSGT